MYVKDMGYIQTMFLKDIKQIEQLTLFLMIVKLLHKKCFAKELINKNGQKNKVLKRFPYIQNKLIKTVKII